ncbi:hypothetical protein B0H13DRAFT_2269923 [Mycena leptocephala]|nr:hypothetical protein B0H13DRAFT_2269923 [Mycena leptocephala]
MEKMRQSSEPLKEMRWIHVLGSNCGPRYAGPDFEHEIQYDAKSATFQGTARRSSGVRRSKPGQLSDSPASASKVQNNLFHSVLTSLLLATAATPVQARAGSCIPTHIPNTGANFVNGQMPLGVHCLRQMKNPTVPLVPTFVADPSGNGLRDLTVRMTTSPKNLWTCGISCQNFEDPSVAYGCSIISLADTTQRVEAGTTGGQLALVKKCTGLRYGSQIFDMCVETLA